MSIRDGKKIFSHVSLAAFLVALSQVLVSSAYAASDGIDSTSSPMHIAVTGQTAFVLTADPSGSPTPTPQISFVGPIVEGTTTLNTNGTFGVNLGAGAAPQQTVDIAGTLGLAGNAYIFAVPYSITGNPNWGASLSFVTQYTNEAKYPLGDHSGAVNSGSRMWIVGAVAADAPAVDAERFEISRWDGSVWSYGLDILPSGNVGIGTWTPSTNLEIDGQTDKPVSLLLDANGTGNIPQYLDFSRNNVVQWALAGGGITSPPDNNLYVMNMPDNAARA